MATSAVGNVVHFSPGRVRVRLDPRYRTEETFQRIADYVTGTPGVTDVETNVSTGSVLVRYDPQVISIRDLVQWAGTMGLALGDAEPGQAGGDGGWASAIDRGRVADAALLLGVAALGGFLGPFVGLSARVGSISAAGATVLGRRWLRSRVSGRRAKTCPEREAGPPAA